MRRLILCLAPLLFPIALTAQDLSGVIDFHAHSHPDSRPRSIDALALARLAKERGMRGIILKNHFEPTGQIAYVVRKVVPGIEVFGGVVLNRAAGGINPAAVEEMAALEGKFGRIVWMPTFESENYLRRAGSDAPFVRTSVNGKLIPEVGEVLGVIAKNDLILATGHISPDESLTLIRDARKAGVNRIIVTHAATLDMTIPQMKEAAQSGAYIEFVFNALFEANPPGKRATAGLTGQSIKGYAAAMRAVGVDHCIISSDLGQVGNRLHPDGMLAFFTLLREQGFSEADVNQMAKTNPATLLGIP